ncbi:uncharacterized protein LOC122955273 [Acropora millepora]|uniref:uncharacterized protein LOC122955273 n=1 Tax=Acropora millepora TaxID=45264 RepID=UPI001CF211EB|nr:uncharacterized protein LOC122955273 [Acropora millepora]
MFCEGDGWKTCDCEEEADEHFFGEEEGDEDSKSKMEKAKQEVSSAGMLLVSDPEWKRLLKEKLTEACKNEDTLKEEDFEESFKVVEKAGKATCFILRSHSHLRDGGCGTGFLISPKSPYGWLTITNNHVIKNDEEAKVAKVIFDFEVDGRTEGTKTFQVSRVVSKDLPTVDTEDVSHLDFSILVLECSVADEAYLKERAVLFEETARVNASSNNSLLGMHGLTFLPLIAFSHPRGLAKRLSIGKYPSNTEKYPIAHIKHQLPTTKGSSGANLLFSFPGTGPKFRHWLAAFLHYRHGRAVAWQAIGPKLREDFCSLEAH